LKNASLISITDPIRIEVLGVLEYWSIGVLEYWSAGVMEKRMSALLMVDRFVLSYFFILTPFISHRLCR